MFLWIILFSLTTKWASKQIPFNSPLFSMSKYVFDSEHYKTRRNFALREKWKSLMQFKCVLLATGNLIAIVCFTEIVSLFQFMFRKFEFSKSVGLTLICLFSLPVEVHLSDLSAFFFQSKCKFWGVGSVLVTVLKHSKWNLIFRITEVRWPVVQKFYIDF